MAVKIYFLCSPDCPKRTKIENSCWKCVSRHICLLICACNTVQQFTKKIGDVPSSLKFGNL